MKIAKENLNKGITTMSLKVDAVLRESKTEKLIRETLALLPSEWMNSDDLSKATGWPLDVANKRLAMLHRNLKVRRRERTGYRAKYEYKKFNS